MCTESLKSKKNDTTAMTTVTNEAYIEKLHENCYLTGK